VQREFSLESSSRLVFSRDLVWILYLRMTLVCEADE
jgi:hypothetical protein